MWFLPLAMMAVSAIGQAASSASKDDEKKELSGAQVPQPTLGKLGGGPVMVPPNYEDVYQRITGGKW